MQTPALNQAIRTPWGADWLEEPFYFFVGDDGPADNFTGCSLAGGVYLKDRKLLDLSSSSGFAAITLPNIVNIAVPFATLQAAISGPGTFKTLLNLVTVAGQIQPLFVAGFEVYLP